jgi:hypothetical protein
MITLEWDRSSSVLGNAGVNVMVKEYPKAPHMLLLVDKLLELPVIDDVVKVLRDVVR